MEKDPNRPFSWEEEDAKLAEAQEDCRKVIERIELLVGALEKGYNKEINALIVKYANAENKTPQDFYRFFMPMVKGLLDYLQKSYTKEISIYSKDKTKGDKAMEDGMHFGRFEQKYPELCQFDVRVGSKITSVSENTKIEVKETLPNE